MAFVFLFLITFCSLAFEILITRSVFVVFDQGPVSIFLAFATFGFALGGIAFALLKTVPRRFEVWATISLVVMVPSFVLSFVLLSSYEFAQLDGAVSGILGAAAIFYVGPGIYAAYMFAVYRSRTAWTYALDLFGAGCGAIAAFWAMSAFGRETSVALVFALLLLGLLAAIPRRGWWLGGGAAVAALLAWWMGPLVMRPLECELFHESGVNVTTVSNAYVQMSWASGPAVLAVRSPRVHLTAEQGQQIVAAHLATLDCRGITMTYEPRSPSGSDFLRQEIHAAPFLIRSYASGVFFGTGLGIDVKRARYFGVKQVTAIEINPFFIGLEKKLLGSSSDYSAPGVETWIGDARFLMTAHPERLFDLIYISSVKHYGHVGASPMALLVNRQLTLEAMETYWQHLNAGGILFFADTLDHVKRLDPNVKALLEHNGLPVEGHVAFVDDRSSYGGYLLSKTEWTEAQRESLHIAAVANHWRLSFEPGVTRERPIATDDKPAVQNAGFLRGILFRPSWFSGLTLFSLIASVGLVGVGGGLGLSGGLSQFARRSAFLSYFWLLGFVFMACEVGLIQGFALLFEQPLHGLMTCLLTLLFGAGLGSLLSVKFSSRTIWLVTHGLLAVWLFFLFRGQDALVHAFYLDSAILRTLLTMAVILPLAILTGMLFPLTMSRLGASRETLIPVAIAAGGAGNLVGALGANLAIAFLGISYIYMVCSAGVLLMLALVCSATNRSKQFSSST